MDCQKHKKDLFGETDMKKVAEAIGDLHYESLSELFRNLSLKFGNDGNRDYQKGRYGLAQQLHWLGKDISMAYHRAKSAWQISKPFMDNNQKPNE